MGRSVPAIVMAGDRGAARAVHGESKVYLEVAKRPLVAHVVATLQRVPQVASVWVVGDAARLQHILGDDGLRGQLRKPLHVIEQFENFYQNAWQGYRRTLSGAPDGGRDPEGQADCDHQVLYLSGDLPFATPQEIAEFVGEAQETGCDYAIGMTAEPSLEMFQPVPGQTGGIEVTYFNLREARLKQNNLHLARPARILNRHYIEDMYEHRKQREVGSMISLAWRLLTAEEGGPSIAFFYGLTHLAGVLDRWRLRWLADRARQLVSVSRVERALSQLMRTSVRMIVAESGGCAIDVDTEDEYDAICDRYEELYAQVCARAEATSGPLALPDGSGAVAS